MVILENNHAYNTFNSQIKTMNEIFTHHFNKTITNEFNKEAVILNWCLCFRRAVDCIKDILSRTQGRTKDDIKDMTYKEIIDLANKAYLLGEQNLNNWYAMINSYYDILDQWCDLMSNQDHIINIIVDNYYPLLVNFLARAKNKYNNMAYR